MKYFFTNDINDILKNKAEYVRTHWNLILIQ